MVKAIMDRVFIRLEKEEKTSGGIILADTIENYEGIYTAYQNDNGGEKLAGGIQLLTQPDKNYTLAAANNIGGSYGTTYIPYADSNTVKHIAVIKNGVPYAQYYVTSNGGEMFAWNNTQPEYVYVSHNYPLQLGCTVGWWQSLNGFAPMTMHRFEVWNYAMSAEEAAEKLGIVQNDTGSLLYSLPQETTF